MNIKVSQQDASGWLGASIKVTEVGNQFFGEDGVVTNVLPAADGTAWSLRVHIVKFPNAEAQILSPADVIRVGLNAPN